MHFFIPSQLKIHVNLCFVRCTIFLVLVVLLQSQGQYWRPRSTPLLLSTTNDTYQCDYYAHYCLRAYNTSMICGRTMHWIYHSFRNYCMLDYVNCIERYELWQVAYMGPCFYMWPKEKLAYLDYRIYDDAFMDKFYLSDEWNLEHMWKSKKKKSATTESTM